MPNLAIVVIGYNRPHALLRLLNSLDCVAFDGHQVPLIISLDRSGNEEVQRVAEAFTWRHGAKTVRTFPQRQGLKQHVLACGDLTRDHEHLIVLEDDLYVSRNLYRFAVQAIDFYKDDDRIAGISLYTHLWNVACDRPFLPLDDASDVYFMQYACSWGQIWSRDKWNRFVEWFRQHEGDFQAGPAIPFNVAEWSEHSWLKHHIRYCIETDRFFVYPRAGLSTNFSDKGQHNVGQENGYQIPLQERGSEPYRFLALQDSRAVYDAFFESLALAEPLGVDPRDLCVDLYGIKRNQAGARYWLTLEPAGHKVLRTFDLAFRPQESNVLHGVPGSAIKLYDTSVAAPVAPGPEGGLEDALVKYDVRSLSYKALLRFAFRMALRRLKAKLSGRG
ncbi:hypothetical protein GETHLI_33320 [Geothrix limicola]|uniref:Uncharacterized protein n=1 Tax=Geothrix limicola TaxID=2927978 RepID=A0ABQ5QIZ0_9BACT|nr:hypothetical protein [Geothrix limicola]GLH74830.1 hypothetical protein GETHLI_33320 [Geothrix limicola]